jgi:hypothetical protein
MSEGGADSVSVWHDMWAMCASGGFVQALYAQNYQHLCEIGDLIDAAI